MWPPESIQCKRRKMVGEVFIGVAFFRMFFFLSFFLFFPEIIARPIVSQV